ncbi:exonuclease SbcC [Clostridium kluyveri]|uniref:Exonuclease SbcC n=1 Tax=Clostridium kluyveri TaxID=1534 RepID=A0A1L5FCE4_CLOKL|nr:exonuclease SbcC [Clostridium kluyveri]APM40490.1 exonuclease SbcC [Clostridium kluyveri]
MNEYEKRVLQARKEFIALNFQQEKELFNIYKNAGDKLIDEILSMPDSRTRNHKIEQYKIINEYRAELYYKLSKTIENNIRKSSDIQKGVQLSFVDMISPDEATNKALKRTITKVSSDTVRQLIAGNYYKDGKTLSRRLWNITGDNGSKVDMIIKANIAKGANVKKLAAELEKYVNPKNRITPKTFADGLGGDNISYQARRLARTSITHAQTETLIQNAKKNPFCKGLKWNLSASHSARMHGRMDICDEYNGKVFKPEDLPLQHPNCLCYMTEVIEEFGKCIETMKDWSKNKVNSQIKSNIDEWVKEGDSKTSIKVSVPDEIQTKINYDADNKIVNMDKEQKWSTVKDINTQYKNKKEISDHLKESYDIKFSDSRKYPIDKELLQSSINWLDKFHNYFKGFKEVDPVKLPSIKIKANITPVGYYRYYPEHPEAVELVLNGEYFCDQDYNTQYIKQCIKSKWTIPNAKSYKTFIHEYGHHVADSLKWFENNELDSDNWCKNFINDVLLEYNKKYDNTYSFKDISELVSRYGGTNPAEAFAETFAEYFGGDTPREFAQVFGEIVEQKLKKHINKG